MSPATPERPALGAAADRLPPQDLDAEMACLGSMLMSREAVGDVLGVILKSESGWFYHPQHQKLFEVLIDLYDRNEPIDLMIVSEELRKRGLFEAVGGQEYMIQLAESFADWANARHYARLVRDKGMLRDLIRCAGDIADQAYSATEDAREILDEAERKLFSVTERRVSAHASPIGEALRRLAERIELREDGALTGLPTGFYKLDELTSGFQNGDLIIVAGRPSMGKTALGLTIAEHMSAHRNLPVAFFSMEMSSEQVAQRVLCSYTRFDSHKLRRRLISETELHRLLEACDELSRAPLFVDDTPGMTILELRSKARRMSMQHQIRAVFVDYLQLMHAPGQESRQTEVAAISRGLKALGRELNIPIIVMAQLNRMSEERTGHRPRMSDLRESGAIEQDADVVLLIHREEYYKPDDESLRGSAELIIAKQRNGPTDTVELQYNARYTRFDNRSHPGAGGDPRDTREPAPF
ncbi:MAG: replicative DNA helicase [Planctomycetota bacterium]|nr:MAG: replicative DNA helicase [Planctomycetota bacterium]